MLAFLGHSNRVNVSTRDRDRADDHASVCRTESVEPT